MRQYQSIGSMLLALLPLALAQSSTTSISSGTDASPSPTDVASTSTVVDTSPPYTITALPAVQSADSCVFNCLIPIGLADPSGCDDVSENCACLSAPSDALDALTECIATVCQSSTSELQASVTSLYGSYCESVYGTMTFEAAITANEVADVAEASAAASSSLASKEATVTQSSATSSPTPSSTPKSAGVSTSPNSCVMGSLFLCIFLLSALS